MLRRGNGERRVRPQFLVVNERTDVSGQKQAPGFRLKSQRPVIGWGIVHPPGVSPQVVHQIATADNQDPFLA